MAKETRAWSDLSLSLTDIYLANTREMGRSRVRGVSFQEHTIIIERALSLSLSCLGG